MAGQAHFVLLGGRNSVFASEDDLGRFRYRVGYVIVAHPMAGFARPVGERRSSVRDDGMLGLKNRENRIPPVFVMANDALGNDFFCGCFLRGLVRRRGRALRQHGPN